MHAQRFALGPDALSVASLTRAVIADSSRPVGALATFVGLVRAENLGRAVLFLEYEAYEPMALKAFARIEEETRAEWPSTTIGLHHRTGRLEIGEASIAIVAASAHRADAFAACRYAIERVKQIAPIWKHEHFEGGETWIEGATADPGDETARNEARRRACA
jgi:molybdopterin synthase catalytic subunit